MAWTILFSIMLNNIITNQGKHFQRKEWSSFLIFVNLQNPISANRRNVHLLFPLSHPQIHTQVAKQQSTLWLRPYHLGRTDGTHEWLVDWIKKNNKLNVSFNNGFSQKLWIMFSIMKSSLRLFKGSQYLY